MEDFKAGDRAIYIGCIDEQVAWGSNDDPRKVMIEGDIYRIEKVELHSYHTKLRFRGIKGKFNSVCFKKYDYTHFCR
jgi:hypothetical protein